MRRADKRILTTCETIRLGVITAIYVAEQDPPPALALVYSYQTMVVYSAMCLAAYLMMLFGTKDALHRQSS